MSDRAQSYRPVELLFRPKLAVFFYMPRQTDTGTFISVWPINDDGFRDSHKTP
jgi:hypothetical protein